MIVKICKRHGELTADQCTKGVRTKCKKCININAKNCRVKNREKYLAYRKAWRKKRKAEGFIKPKSRRQRRLYDPNAEGYLMKKLLLVVLLAVSVSSFATTRCHTYCWTEDSCTTTCNEY